MAADPPDLNAALSALETRRSVRGFLPEAVDWAVVERILVAAARAPSATNTQPWRIRVLTGAAKERLSAAILAARAEGGPEPAPEYAYYPDKWVEPYLSRRRTVGWQLYGALGIARGDRAAARAWHDRNFTFFGAPVGLILTTDRRLGIGAFIDCGMFLQGVATAARGFGLDTCPQAAFASYHGVIRAELELAPEELVVCGMALGRADARAAANTLRAERAALADWAAFLE